MKKIGIITIVLLIVIWAVFVLYKINVLGVKPTDIIPIKAYDIVLKMSFKGHGNKTSITTYIPPQTSSQNIEMGDIDIGKMKSSLSDDGLNKVMVLSKSKDKRKRTVRVSWRVIPTEIEYHFSDSLPLIDLSTIDNMKIWLSPTDLIQSNSSEIKDLTERLGIAKSQNMVKIVNTAYEYAHDSLVSAKFSAQTDAVLALTLQEASCNGKSRLFVAINRHLGIPARLVGGIIMNKREKSVTHQWAEVYMGGEWVPFDPLNGHIATIPTNYLKLYVGDKALFTRSSNINFRYSYEINRVMVSRSDNRISKISIFNTARVWEVFKEAGLSLDLLRILLMIPLGAIIIIIFRNVIGVHTFGTFLPVLIATSMQSSGLFWGMIIFTSVIISGIFVRQLLERYQLLHSPKMTIILISVITTLIIITLIGVKTGQKQLLSASMFPLAILAITTERFCTVIEASGIIKAISIFLWTLVVVAFSYLSMLSVIIQSFVMVFPETLLLIIAMSIYLGSWNSLRLGL